MLERAGKRNANNEKYQIWHGNSEPSKITIQSNYQLIEMMDQKLDYIHQNPVKEGSITLTVSAFKY